MTTPTSFVRHARPDHRSAVRRTLLQRFAPVIVLCTLLAPTAGWTQDTPAAPAKVQVTGAVARPMEFGVPELRQLAVQRVEDVRQVRMDGAPADGAQTRSYTGVRLRDVIAAAKPDEKERHDLRRSIVVLTAADGYRVVFSWAELFISPIGDGALVVFERDGAPLGPGEGPLALVSLRDTQPGPRHVKWLSKIELRRVD
jgi:DMSO/TMAO reductase YedYZ molybdopterin-dependent catalytic subunit